MADMGRYLQICASVGNPGVVAESRGPAAKTSKSGPPQARRPAARARSVTAVIVALSQ